MQKKFIFDKISANEKQKKSIENIHETTSTTGVPYFTDNDNIFIAPENISQEEIEKLSYETDVNVFKDEIAKLKKQIEELTAKLENKIELHWSPDQIINRNEDNKPSQFPSISTIYRWIRLGYIPKTNIEHLRRKGKFNLGKIIKNDL